MTERQARIAEARLSQPIAELQRKADKARSKSNLWQQEELDAAKASALDLVAGINWE